MRLFRSLVLLYFFGDKIGRLCEKGEVMILLNSKRDTIFTNAYNDWAYHECMNYIYSHVNKNPIDACEDFRHMMDIAAMDAKTEYAKLIFITAYETATNILDDLIITNLNNIGGNLL